MNGPPARCATLREVSSFHHFRFIDFFSCLRASCTVLYALSFQPGTTPQCAARCSAVLPRPEVSRQGQGAVAAEQTITKRLNLAHTPAPGVRRPGRRLQPASPLPIFWAGARNGLRQQHPGQCHLGWVVGAGKVR